MIKRQDGVNPDGTPHYNFELTQEEHDAGHVAMFTGPIAGVFSVANGEGIYDVTEDVIPVKKEHVGELHIAIHKAHHAAGRFLEHPLPELAEVSLPADE